MLTKYLPFFFKKKIFFPEKLSAKMEDLQKELDHGFPVTLKIERGSITKVRADAIVNSTNRMLIKGGGLDWAVHDAAGEELQNEIINYAPCEDGEVVVSKGYNLPCTYVLHTVTPVWSNGFKSSTDGLRACYQNIFKAADELGIRSLAIPAIGTGVHETPLDVSAMIACEEFAAHFENYDGSIEEVIFVLFSSSSLNTYCSAFEKYDISKSESPRISSLSFSVPQTTLELNGNFAINIVPSHLNKITAFGNGLDFEVLETQHMGDLFLMESHLSECIILHVASSNISNIVFSGEGSIEFEDTLKKSLTLNINGDIDVSITGIVETLNIIAVGDGTIDAIRSNTKHLSIKHQGMYEIRANASESVSIMKEGFGDIRITGSPHLIDSHDNGVGEIIIA